MLKKASRARGWLWILEWNLSPQELEGLCRAPPYMALYGVIEGRIPYLLVASLKKLIGKKIASAQHWKPEFLVNARLSPSYFYGLLNLLCRGEEPRLLEIWSHGILFQLRRSTDIKMEKSKYNLQPLSRAVPELHDWMLTVLLWTVNVFLAFDG